MALPVPLMVTAVGGVLKLGGEIVGGMFAKQAAELLLEKLSSTPFRKLLQFSAEPFVLSKFVTLPKTQMISTSTRGRATLAYI